MSQWLLSKKLQKWLHPGYTARTPFGQGDLDKSHNTNMPKDELAPSEPERTLPPSGDKQSEGFQEGEGPLGQFMGKPNVDYPVHSNPSCSREEV